MLELRQPALCTDRVRAPFRWHSHSWLCSVQYATAVIRDRVSAPESASLRTADSRHSGAHTATFLESHSCTSTPTTSVKSPTHREKNRGAPPPRASIQLGAARGPHPSVSKVRFFPARPRRGVNLATTLLRAANFWQIGFAARSFAAIPGDPARPASGARSWIIISFRMRTYTKTGVGGTPSRRFLTMTRKPRPAAYDGALVIDKPRGRTSHDVVEAAHAGS